MVAVYTCIVGGFDTLKPPCATVGVEWVAYTDVPMRGPAWAPAWERRPTRTIDHTGRLAARWYKTHPHRVLANRDATVYIDGSVTIRDPMFLAEAVAAARSSPLGVSCFRHPERDDIVEEAAVAAGLAKYHPYPIREKAEQYLDLGVPRHGGLWATTIVCRVGSAWRGHHAYWWSEIRTGEMVDQLAFAAACWQVGMEPADLAPRCGRLWESPMLALEQDRRRNQR